MGQPRVSTVCTTRIPLGRRRAGAGAATQSRVGGRLGGGDVAGASERLLLRLGGIVGGLGARGLVAPAGTLRGAAPSCLYLSHRAMAGQGQTPPVGHSAEAPAFLCILGRGLNLMEKERMWPGQVVPSKTAAMAGGGSPRFLLLVRGVFPVNCLVPKSELKAFWSKVLSRGDKSTLFVSWCPERDD